MKRRVSCVETADQWKAVLELSQVQLPSVDTTDTTGGKDDPFDCSDVAVPPTFELVEQVVKENQLRWKQLDERKLAPSPASKDEEEEEEEEENASGSNRRKVRFQEGPAKKKEKKGGWRFVEDRLRLPYNFDYATVGPEPQDDETGERVLSLASLLREDPTQQSTSSYEQELWKLFASIPSVKQLEQEASAGAQLEHTMALQKEITTMMEERHPPDAHLLVRMRMADRHGLPPPTTAPRNEDGSPRMPDSATIRVECWKRQPKRHPTPDPCRLVLEFLADQTLLDLHSTLVQMAEDDLWDDGTKESETPSGCFFIEDKFYIHGSVDYAKPIIDWIDAGSDKPHPARRGYLGLSSLEMLETKPMKDTRLSEIPMRLGYRYYHACHGDVETSFCVVDRRWTWKAPTTPYPIIHDIWTPSSNLPVCDACKTYTAAFITSATCPGSGCQRRTLCNACRQQLKVRVHLYSAWRDEANLSTSLGVQSRRKF